MSDVKRYSFVEHHHQSGHYGEEQWSTFSIEERHDGTFVLWKDYEQALHDRVLLTREVCIVAAIKFKQGIIRGHRHYNCFALASARGWDTYEEVQGFITSRNRFVGREEALQLQLAAGIESVAQGGYRPPNLFSEDLY